MKLTYLMSIFVTYVLLSFAHASPDDSSLTEDCDFNAKLSQAFQDFSEGHYDDAAPILKKGCAKRHPLALEYYADICREKRDNLPHTYREAAMYYIAAAFSGHTDIYSWLASVDDRIVSETAEIEDQMNILVRHWELDEFDANYQKKNASTLTNYIAWNGGEIGKTKCQKTPYLYLLTVHSLRFLSIVEPNIHNVFTHDDKELHFDISDKCRDTFVHQNLPNFRRNLAPMVYGITEPGSFKAMRSKMRDNPYLPRPRNKPDLDFFSEQVMDSVQTFMDKRSATEISNFTHHSLSWLIAGLKYYQKKNPGALPKNIISIDELQNIFDHPENDLTKKQLSMLLCIIEPKYVWPKRKDQAIVKDFQNNLNKEFFSDRIVNSKEVKELLVPILQKARKIKVDFESPAEVEQLTSGFLLQFCEDLELKHLQSKEQTYNRLFNACSHLGFLKTMTVQFSDTFDQDNQYGEKIFAIILYFQSKCVDIKFD